MSRRLSTGQTISLTKQDEKMLRAAYDYMQGFAKRTQLEQFVELKKTEVRASSPVLSALHIVPLYVLEYRQKTYCDYLCLLLRLGQGPLPATCYLLPATCYLLSAICQDMCLPTACF